MPTPTQPNAWRAGDLRLALATILLMLGSQLATAQTTDTAPAPTNRVAKSPALLAQILMPAAINEASDQARRFFSWIGGKLSGAASSLADSGTPAAAGSSTAANLKPATGVVYVVDRLASDFSVRESITPLADAPPVFQSRERFAIRYTSNAPGVVVIMNVDALKNTAYLGTFVIQPGVEARFPETDGMMLDDVTGLETYQMVFMACVPPQLANQPDVVARRGQIPECGSTAQAEKAIQSALNGKRTKGTTNMALKQADGSNKAMLSMTDYQKGDVTSTTFTLQHVPATAAQAPAAAPADQPPVKGQI